MSIIPRWLLFAGALGMALGAAILALLFAVFPVSAKPLHTYTVQLIRNGWFDGDPYQDWLVKGAGHFETDDFGDKYFTASDPFNLYEYEAVLSQTVYMPASASARLDFSYWGYPCRGCEAGIGVGYTNGSGAMMTYNVDVFDATPEIASLDLGAYPEDRAVTIEFYGPSPNSTFHIGWVELVAESYTPKQMRVLPSSIFTEIDYLQSEPVTRTLQTDWRYGSPVDWTLSADQPWIRIPKPTGKNSMMTEIVIDPATFGAGTYTGNVTLRYGEDGQEVIIPVTARMKGSVDIGVLRGEDHTCGALDEAVMVLDEGDPTGSIFGWQAGISQPNHMWFAFCRMDGRQFKPYGVSKSTPGINGKALDYAVLKLGHDCPDGSYEFRRDIDTEDTKGGKKNDDRTYGKIWPNFSGGNATFYFCYFPGQTFDGAVPATHMTAFPRARVSYGVFAAASHHAALESGWAMNNGEWHNNRNNMTFAPGFPTFELQRVKPIIDPLPGASTAFHYIKVFDAPQTGSAACAAAPYLFCTHDITRKFLGMDMVVDRVLVAPQYCPAAPRPIDLTISLDRNPKTAERAQYEAIIKEMADGVYESSNGVNRLRDVIIYVNRQNARSANIRWAERGQPTTQISGYHPGVGWSAPIYMYDQDYEKGVYIQNYMNPSNRSFAMEGGHLLAHEFGHFFYGLDDEYQTQAFDTPVSQSIMTDHKGPSRGGNYTSLNFSHTNKGQNNQFRTYGASGWDTLTRNPNDDPRHAKVIEAVCDESYFGWCADWDEAVVANARACLPEMAWVDPGAQTLVELPAQEARAREELTIIWWGSHAPPPDVIPLLNVDGDSNDKITHKVTVSDDDDKINVTVRNDEPDAPPPTIIVRRPDGSEERRVVCTSAPGAKETHCQVLVICFVPGPWTVEVDNPGKTPQDVEIVLIHDPGKSTPITAEVAVAGGDSVAYPKPVVVQAVVRRELPMTAVGVTGYVRSPSGIETPLVLVDDGSGSDTKAGDGIYMAAVDYRENGDHEIVVMFDNKQSSALYVMQGTDGADETTPETEPFERVATTWVTIGNVQPDDHANVCATGTPLTPNGAAYTGRMDGAGDRDFFIVESVAGGTYVLRMDGLFAGMLPRVRISDAATGALIKEVEVDPAAGAYLMTELAIPAGGKLCLEVSHQQQGADEGNFKIEIGDVLDSEVNEALIVAVRGTAAGALVTRTLNWEVLARVGDANAAGAGVTRVVAAVYGPDGQKILEKEFSAPAYCVVGDGSCAAWDFVANGGKWPHGEAVQTGQHTLVATAWSASQRAETVSVGVRIELAPGTPNPPDPPDASLYSISGRVTLAGAGLQGVTLTAGGKSATTDAAGNYTLAGLLPGAYTLTPSLVGHTFAPPSRAVTIGTAHAVGNDFTATKSPANPVDPDDPETPTQHFEYFPNVHGQ